MTTNIRESTCCTGLFSSFGGTINDLFVTDATVIGGTQQFSYIAGTGGIIGFNNGWFFNLVNVHFDGAVEVISADCSNPQQAGGLVGAITSASGAIMNSSSTGTVSTTGPICNQGYSAGGLIGSAEGIDIANSFSSADVQIDGDVVGGCNYSRCRNIGGLVGALEGNQSTINHSYSSGQLSATDSSQSNRSYVVGGLVGLAYSNYIGIGESFSTGHIQVPAACSDQDCGTNLRVTGGIVGYHYDSGTLSTYANFYDQQRTGVSTCVDDNSDTEVCTPVNTVSNPDPNYFYANETNMPMAFWDFEDSYWQIADELPSQITTKVTPDTPSNVQATTTSSSSITVTWDIPDHGRQATLAGYAVAWAKAGTDDWQYQELYDDDVTSYAVSGLDPVTEYKFKVVAKDWPAGVSNSEVWGVPSAEVTGMTSQIGFHLIRTCQDLQNMNQDLGANYEIVNDIDCSDTVHWNNGDGFVSIGYFPFGHGEISYFTGILAGNNHRIDNLYATGANGVAALFGATNNALIQDLQIHTITIQSNSAPIGSAFIAAAIGGTEITNVHIHNGVVGGPFIAAGGFVAYSQTYDGGKLAIKRSEFNGTIASTSPMQYYMGGLIAFSVGNAHEEVVVENSFANATITTINQPTTGGLIGLIGSQDLSIRNSYATGALSTSTVTPESTDYYTQDGPDIFPISGGLVGLFIGPQTIPTLNNTFSSVSSVGWDYTGGLANFADMAPEDIIMNNNYFDTDVAGTADCDAIQIATCTGITGQPNYFKNNSTNPPLDQWDFSDIWTVSSDFPQFSTKVLTTITAISEERLSKNQTATPTPNNGNSVGSGEGATVAAAAASSGKNGGVSAISKPSDEAGILGALKHFVRNLPAGVVVAFPYALFGLLLLVSLFLAIELIREVRRAHIIEALISKQRLLAEERDAFWHLAAHYLRAPITLIVGGAEALHESHSGQQPITISALAASLQVKVSEIMKKIESSASLQNIKPMPAGMKRGKVGRATYLIPLGITAILVIFANYAASSWRNLNPGTLGYLVQFGIFIVVALLLYWTLSFLSGGRKRRQQAEMIYEQQTTELSNARHELIADTTKLGPELTKLEKLIKELPASTAKTAAGALTTLQDGSTRLREIVSSFTLLLRVQESTGQVQATTSTTDLTSTLNRVRSKLTPQITAKGVRVVAPALPLAVTAEATMANQVLESIVANAVDYSPANGTVKVEARKLQDKIQLRISDQGKGIDKKQLDHLFQPFVRADGSSAMDMSHGGFGINLYLDKLIMEQMGGSISAASTPGKGTAITMEWPVN